MTHLPRAWTALFCLAAVLGTAAAASAADPLDWTYWRGPEMNGVSREKNLPESWDPEGGEGSNLLWKRDDLGSRSTPVVMGGKLYTLCRHKPGTKEEAEKVVCVRADNGETIWEQVFNVFLSDVPDTRVAWSAVTADPDSECVYALGVCGLLQCFDAASGEIKWSHSMSEEYGMLTTYGGRTNFPLVHESNLIISGVTTGWGDQAKPAHRIVAFDKRNGQATWITSTRLLPEDTTYSAPTIATINGQTLYIIGCGDGIMYALQPRTGAIVWKVGISQRGLNTTPVVSGNTVIVGHSEENLNDIKMGGLVAVDGSKSGDLTKEGVLWFNKEWFVGKTAPLVLDGRVYGIDDSGNMMIADIATGERIAKQKLGTMGRSSPLYADGKIYVTETNGRWYTFKPSADGVETVFKTRLPSGEECNGSPIVSHGRLYVPSSGALYCIGFKDTTPLADPIPAPPAETPVSEDRTPAVVQLVPAESLLRPEIHQQRFQVRLYNKNGQYVGMAKPEEVTYTVAGPGSVDATGLYQPGDVETESAVMVTAKVGDISGLARVRLVPDLDWTFNFDNGSVPVTWIGSAYRHVVIDYDYFTELNAANPAFAQLYLYLLSDFINTGKPASVYDDSTPRETWTGLLIFMRYHGSDLRPTSVDAAKTLFDPLLTRLKDDGFLADWTWEDWAAEVGGQQTGGPRLKVTRGARPMGKNGVLCKISTIPKGTRSQGWMGHTDFHDYTIQADVMGALKDGQLPDVGLIAQRYTIDLMGEAKKLQIRTWPPQLRMAQSIPFVMQPDTWYTLKMKASVENGLAVLRGKVWEKGQPEPEAWMLEATDPSPNLTGSPGLFGNAQNAECFYDNLTVTRNAP